MDRHLDRTAERSTQPGVTRVPKLAAADSGGGAGWRRWLLAACAAAALGAGALVLGVGGGGDSLSPAEIQQRAEAFKAVTAAPAIVLSTEEARKYLASDPQNHDGTPVYTPERREEITRDLERGDVEVIMFALFDDKVVDGDIVALRSTATTQTVSLSHAPMWIGVPVDRGAPLTVVVDALVDGGGGVTIGMSDHARRIPLPYMVPGQSVTVTVR